MRPPENRHTPRADIDDLDRDLPDSPRPDRVGVRASDLPLLYVLAFVHAAVLVFLPIASFFVIRFLRNWPNAENRPRSLVPVLFVAVILVEAGLFWRFKRVLSRLRRGRGGR